MQNAGVLLTIAQIAIAFAGFASLAGVLGRAGARDDPRFDAWRLRNILEAALAVVLFALAPFVPHAFALGEAAIWRLCAAAFLVWNAVGFVLSARRAAQLQERGAGGSPIYALLFVVLEIGINVPLAAIVFSLVGTQAAPLYLFALMLALLQAALFFVRLVGSLLDAGPGPS